MDSRVIKKQLFQIQRTIAFWKRILWIYFAENINKFEMWPLVIFNIIPKLPLFLFWNPNFTKISIKKNKKIPSCRRIISLHSMLSPRQLQETQKKNRTMQVVVVLLSFSFLQLLTNQTDYKILNQMCNFQFQHKPINSLLLRASSSIARFFFCSCGFFFSHFLCVCSIVKILWHFIISLNFLN